MTGRDRIWSNDTHIYVTDADVGRVFQYNRSDKSLTSNDYSLHTDNGEPRGIWSDGTTVWVSDRNGLKLYAYQLSDFSRDSGKDITQSGVQVHFYGIWSDGVFMWLLEQDSSGTSRKKLEARALSDWSLQPGLEVLGAHDNLDYRSLWSDGTTMYVAETTGTPRIRNFPMPANIPGPPTGRSGSVLLSNTGQTGSNTDLNFYDKASQPFTTGPSAYELTGIEIPGAAALVSLDLNVTLREDDGSGDPADTALALFRNLTWGKVDDNSFTLSPAVTLAANTKYHIHLDAGISVRAYRSDDNAADDGSLNGWSFDSRRGRNSGAWTEATNAIQMALRGDLAQQTSCEESVWDATMTSSTNTSVEGGGTYEGFFSDASDAITTSLGSLSLSSFTVGGTTHTVEMLAFQQAGEQRLYLSTDNTVTKTDLAGHFLRITVDGIETTLAVSNATNLSDAGGIYWDNHGYVTDDWGTKSITFELFRLKGIDFENLACGHDSPTVMWSPDGLTLWVGQESSSKVYAYNLADESLNPTASWTLATGNDKPVGVWSNASHVYVVDGDDRDVYRYNLTNKSAGTATLLTNADRVGAWADGDTMWVSDRVDSKLYAYTLSDFSRDSGKDIDLHSDNGEARDIWSDGHAIWVLDSDDEKLYAYALSDGSRKVDLDITLDGTGEKDNSIWSDGETMYVVENTGTSTTRTPQIYKLPLPTEVLVSNALQSAPSSIPHSSDHAQTFQTGDNYQGYTLEGVTLTATNNVSVTLAAWTTDANGRPDAFHATLTPPASYAAGAVEFTAPADTVLARNTTYALRVGNASGATLDGTTSDAEDAGGQTGWSIGDTHLLWDTATGSWQEDGMSRSYRVTFEGRSNPDTVPGPPILTDLREGHRGLLAEWDSPTDIGDGSIMGAAFWQAEYTRADGTASFHMGVLGNAFRINLNDGEWTFRIRYQNSLGYGQWSNALTATVAPATVTIEGGAAVDEGADAQFTVTSDRFRVTIADDLTVHLDVTEDGDVVPAASEGRISVSFDLSDNNDIANRTKTITVPTEDDSVVEFDSTVTAIIVADSDYIVGFPSEAGVLVDDNEPHDTPFAVEDLAARPAGPGRVFLSWSAVTEQRGDRISRFEYLQADNGGPPKSSSDARIIATLPAGTYTIEAASFIDVPTTVSGIEPTGSFTLSVSAAGGGGAPGPVATGCTPASLSLPVSGVEGAWAPV